MAIASHAVANTNSTEEPALDNQHVGTHTAQENVACGETAGIVSKLIEYSKRALKPLPTDVEMHSCAVIRDEQNNSVYALKLTANGNVCEINVPSDFATASIQPGYRAELTSKIVRCKEQLTSTQPAQKVENVTTPLAEQSNGSTDRIVISRDQLKKNEAGKFFIRDVSSYLKTAANKDLLDVKFERVNVDTKTHDAYMELSVRGLPCAIHVANFKASGADLKFNASNISTPDVKTCMNKVGAADKNKFTNKNTKKKLNRKSKSLNNSQQLNTSNDSQISVDADIDMSVDVLPDTQSVAEEPVDNTTIENFDIEEPVENFAIEEPVAPTFTEEPTATEAVEAHNNMSQAVKEQKEKVSRSNNPRIKELSKQTIPKKHIEAVKAYIKAQQPDTHIEIATVDFFPEENSNTAIVRVNANGQECDIGINNYGLIAKDEKLVYTSETIDHDKVKDCLTRIKDRKAEKEQDEKLKKKAHRKSKKAPNRIGSDNVEIEDETKQYFEQERAEQADALDLDFNEHNAEPADISEEFTESNTHKAEYDNFTDAYNASTQDVDTKAREYDNFTEAYNAHTENTEDVEEDVDTKTGAPGSFTEAFNAYNQSVKDTNAHGFENFTDAYNAHKHNAGDLEDDIEEDNEEITRTNADEYENFTDAFNAHNQSTQEPKAQEYDNFTDAYNANTHNDEDVNDNCDVNQLTELFTSKAESSGIAIPEDVKITRCHKTESNDALVYNVTLANENKSCEATMKLTPNGVNDHFSKASKKEFVRSTYECVNALKYEHCEKEAEYFEQLVDKLNRKPKYHTLAKSANGNQRDIQLLGCKNVQNEFGKTKRGGVMKIAVNKIECDITYITQEMAKAGSMTAAAVDKMDRDVEACAARVNKSAAKNAKSHKLPELPVLKRQVGKIYSDVQPAEDNNKIVVNENANEESPAMLEVRKIKVLKAIANLMVAGSIPAYFVSLQNIESLESTFNGAEIHNVKLSFNDKKCNMNLRKMLYAKNFTVVGGTTGADAVPMTAGEAHVEDNCVDFFAQENNNKL